MNFGSCMRSAGTNAFIPTVPSTNPTPEDVTALLTKEMNELSVEERGQVFEDVHCVSEVKDEDPNMVAKCLVQLEEELAKISKYTAYEQAAQQSPTFVQNVKFRLMFLRADSFDPKKAAYRMIRFMEEKLTLFGLDKLTKKIEISDLDPEDMRMLESGCLMPATEMDRAQRKVMFGVGQLKPTDCSVESLMRVHFIQLMFTVEDDEAAQKNGIVGVIYVVDLPGNHFRDRREVWDTTRLRNACPVRVVCTHFCYNDPTMHALVPLVLSIAGSQNRIRFREHYGTHLECHYMLGSYGIPQHIIPVGLNGEEVCKDRVQKLLRKCPPVTKSTYNHSKVVQQISPELQNLLHSQGGMSCTTQPETSRNTTHISPISTASAAAAPPPLPTQSSSSFTPILSTSFARSSSGVSSSSPSPSPIDMTLGEYDVILGKGRGIQEYPGNIRLRRIIEMQMEKYDSSSKFAKTLMVEHIIRSIKESSGRFLRQIPNNPGWEVVDDVTVHAKVSCTFRARRRLNRESLKKL